MPERLRRLLLVAIGALVLLAAGLYALSQQGAPVVVSPAKSPALARPADLNVIAEVNGVAIYLEQLQSMATIDTALAHWIGAPPPEANELLDRAVNAELVTQAAGQAGYVLPEDTVTATLTTFLAGKGWSPDDLHRILAANSISQDLFLIYYRRLLLVDAFSQRQAEAAGQSVAGYLEVLRQRAEVTLYDQASLALATPIMPVVPPSPVPPTPTSLPSTATPAPPATPTSSPTPVASYDVDRGTAVGALAPDFTLTTLAGDVISWQDLIDSPTVLSFWVTWCGHCRAQTPRLVEAYGRYGEAGVRFLGISVDETRDVVASYVDQQAIPFPIALDSDGSVGARYRVTGFPTTYFLDPEGRVAAVHVGELSTADLDRYIGGLLGEIE